MRASFTALLFGIWLALFAAPNRSIAQTIHAVLVADTKDGSIGTGVAENETNIASFLNNLKTLTELNVASTVIDGANFSCKSIIDSINGLNVAADDAVFFYYAGHGFRRDGSQTQFPEFFCGGPRDPTLTLSQAVNMIQSKQPRLVIAIADACNKITEPAPVIAAAPSIADVDRKGALLRLFKDYRGTLIMSGAIPGEFSWYMTAGASLGGFFTNQLLSAINQNIVRSGARVGWEAIATDAVKPIFVPTIPPVTQNPQYLPVGLSASPVAAAVASAYVSQDQIDPANLRRFWVEDEQSRQPQAAAAPQAAAPPYILTNREPSKFQGSFGIDLSHYTFDIDNDDATCKIQDGYSKPACSCVADWQAVSNSGVRFVYSKASDGAGVDLSFAKFWSDLKAKHEAKALFRGAYHFLRPGVDPDVQADAFLRAVGALNGQKPAQLSPVLDIEWSNKRILPGTPEFQACPDNRRTKNDQGKYFCDMWYQMKASEITVMAQKWINRVEQATGLPVMIYTNPTAWWNPVLKAEGNVLLDSKRAVWTSRYTGPGPKFDSSWARPGQNGSSSWKMAPLPAGASYPRFPGKYSPSHLWQFTEAGFLENNFLTCSGRAVRKSVDMNFLPVSEDSYPVAASSAPR